jgi:16S rRNA G966 N2-methylase RsmD
MNSLSNDQIEVITELLRAGKPLPEEYRWLLFEGRQDTELIYAGKAREVDVLAETMSVPLQKVKVFGDAKVGQWHNMLIFGDNLQILKALLNMKENGTLKNPDGTRGVKLVYIDPPFGTGDVYGNGDVAAYSAKLMGAKYLEWLRQRLILLRELLTGHGSLYMRTDYHFGHYMKVLLDEVLGRENFRNEIVINRFKRQLRGLKQYNVATDSLLFYSRSENVAFAETLRPRICSFCGANKEPEWHHMVSSGLRHPPERTIMGRLMLPPRGQHWKYTQQKIDQMAAEGRIRINDAATYTDIDGHRVVGMPEFLQTEDTPVDSNWVDLKGYQLSARFPTENPEELLERVVNASSDPGDIVLDAFAGSGTTGAVAEKLTRRWIMVDSSKFALYTMTKRMLNLKEKISNTGKSLKPKSFTIYNAGLYDMKMLKELPFREYRQFALQLFQCKDEPHKLAGLELDGYFGQDHVLVFKWKKNGTDNKDEYVMDRGFIDDLHSILGDRTSNRFFIIAPAASVVFLEDYVEKDGIRYYVLRIPYSIIDELHKKNFKLLEQPLSADFAEVNKVMEQVGFDFIYPPDVECEHYIEKQKDKLPDQAVIKITKFRSNVISKRPIPEEDLGFKALSMVMTDYDYNGKYFEMDDKWFASELGSAHEIRFDPSKAGEKMMILYLDVYGNERKELKYQRDFRRKG